MGLLGLFIRASHPSTLTPVRHERAPRRGPRGGGRAAGPGPATALLRRSEPAFRACEASALAAYLRWLVEGKRRTIVDPATGLARPVDYGDVAVLAASTFFLPLLFPELDRRGVPYAARGATLFLSDQPTASSCSPCGGWRTLMMESRRRRSCVPPSSRSTTTTSRARAAATSARRTPASAVLALPSASSMSCDAADSTGHQARPRASPGVHGFCARRSAGAERRRAADGLRELCLVLDVVAAEERLDFDGATARLRAWAGRSRATRPPRPGGRRPSRSCRFTRPRASSSRWWSCGMRAAILGTREPERLLRRSRRQLVDARD